VHDLPAITGYPVKDDKQEIRKGIEDPEWK